MKKCVIIYNPVSGKKVFVNKVDYVVNRMEEAGYEVVVKATGRAKEATQLARDAVLSGIDLLIVSGGDGTLHECINGVCTVKDRPRIGYIPSGTTCDLANTLKIPKNVEKAVDIILANEYAKMDVVSSNKGYFLYVAAIGTYVDISYVTDSKLKKYLGYVAYLLTGIKEFFTIPMMKSVIEHDNGVIKGHFSMMLIVNSKRVAGFNLINKPILDDGLVDVILYRYVPFFNNIIYFISFIFAPKFIPAVHKIRTSKLKISTDHYHKWNMDGEEANSGNLNLSVIKQAVEIIVNVEIKDKYFKES